MGGLRWSISLLGLLLMVLTMAAAKDDFEMWDATECGSSAYNYTANSPYKSNLDGLLTNITTLPIKYGYYNFTTGEDPDQVHAIALCRGDVNVTQCHSCLKFLTANLTASCPIQQGASGWADKCMLNYDSGPLPNGRWVEKPMFKLYTDVEAGGNGTQFADVVGELLMSLPRNAAAGDYRKKFAYGQATVNSTLEAYATMQCTPELKQSDCFGCLYLGMYYIYKYPTQTGARILQPSCSIRYEMYPFYTGRPSGSGKKGVNLMLVIVALGAAFVALVVFLGAFLIWLVPNQLEANRARNKRSHFKSLEMDPSIVKDATRNFSDANKIRDSAVYKGKLYGKEIAVMRIKGNRYMSRTEVLAAKLQHTNLVELLGVCSYGKEKLLIFEYVPRGSLDQILFDPENKELDWAKRFFLIQGIAQGLLYLHNDYRKMVVHSALDASKVLLDEHWRPKITDFSKATELKHTIKGENQTEQTTPQVRQQGAYEAPEPEISDKSDVFNFGVLVLEILLGRKKSVPEKEDLVTLARRTFNNGTVLEIIDQRIEPISDSAKMQIKGCVEIALQCLHEDAKDRANMVTAVERLEKLDRQSNSTPESIANSTSQPQPQPQPQPQLRKRIPSSEITQ